MRIKNYEPDDESPLYAPGFVKGFAVSPTAIHNGDQFGPDSYILTITFVGSSVGAFCSPVAYCGCPSTEIAMRTAKGMRRRARAKTQRLVNFCHHPLVADIAGGWRVIPSNPLGTLLRISFWQKFYTPHTRRTESSPSPLAWHMVRRRWWYRGNHQSVNHIAGLNSIALWLIWFWDCHFIPTSLPFSICLLATDWPQYRCCPFAGLAALSVGFIRRASIYGFVELFRVSSSVSHDFGTFRFIYTEE